MRTDPTCYLLSYSVHPKELSKQNLISQQLGITKISDKHGVNSSLLCLLCGFCLRLSSHSNTESKPERQMLAKSDRSNTLLSPFI